ncbi:MAG: DUF4260 domain-containing protein [Halobacteriaceae archaeon]
MGPRTYLRIEGLAVLGLSLAGYFTLDGSILMLVVLALAPDVSMLGYLLNPKAGSISYNVVHTYTLPLALGAFGFWGDSSIAILLALIWTGHIGADRLVGYGLKFESNFKDTHLSTQPAPISALTESE